MYTSNSSIHVYKNTRGYNDAQPWKLHVYMYNVCSYIHVPVRGEYIYVYMQYMYMYVLLWLPLLSCVYMYMYMCTRN